VTCTLRSLRPSGRPVHDQHGDVIVLLMTGEHVINEVTQQPFRTAEQLLIGAGGHRGQFLQARVQATIPVLDQAVGIEHRRGAGRHAERVLLAR